MPPLLAIPHFFIEHGQGSAGPGPGGAFGMKKEETSGATHTGYVRPATVCVVGARGQQRRKAPTPAAQPRTCSPAILLVVEGVAFLSPCMIGMFYGFGAS